MAPKDHISLLVVIVFPVIISSAINYKESTKCGLVLLVICDKHTSVTLTIISSGASPPFKRNMFEGFRFYTMIFLWCKYTSKLSSYCITLDIYFSEKVWT